MGKAGLFHGECRALLWGRQGSFMGNAGLFNGEGRALSWGMQGSCGRPDGRAPASTACCSARFASSCVPSALEEVVSKRFKTFQMS